MNNFLKVACIGGGIALLLFKDHLAALFQSGGVAVPQPAALLPAYAPPASAATDSQGTKARIYAAVQNDANYVANGGRMSAFQWDFYYKLARGVDAPSPDAMGLGDGTMLLSLDEYWTAATAHGLSGLRLTPRGPSFDRRRSLAARAWSA